MSLFDDLDSERRRRLRDLAETLAERRGTSPGEATLALLEEAAARPAAEPEPPCPGFEIRLFGHPRVTRRTSAGEEEVEWRLRRSLQTLIFLCLAPGRRATREELVEALWPRASRETVAKNFHPTLSDVRRSLAGDGDADELPTIDYRGGLYLLGGDEGAWWVDVDRFESRLEAADAARREERAEVELAALEAAWKLYRGSLVSDLEAPWIERRRVELRRAWLAALERLGTLASEQEREVLALDAWRRLLIEEPFEERVHLRVMELYGRRGRRDLVRRQYVKLQEHLSELEVEPSRETQRRYLELMK